MKKADTNIAGGIAFLAVAILCIWGGCSIQNYQNKTPAQKAQETYPRMEGDEIVYLCPACGKKNGANRGLRLSQVQCGYCGIPHIVPSP